MNIKRTEYEIRKSERGLYVLLKTQKNTTSHTRAEHEYAIQSYAVKIAALKKELYEKTGRCTPSIPRWPT
tara:strand:+ start:72 stop:281 length:210 start_codon:yes stop_codon:yes gene_type:complete